MSAPTLRRRVSRAWGLRRFLRERPSLAQAERELSGRLERRDERFLDVLRALVYANPASPYLPLLERAGCELGDLEAAVRSEGVEATLARLLRDGVRVSLEELKTSGGVFDNPTAGNAGVIGATSGTTRSPSVVALDWRGLAEETTNELVLYAAHGLEQAPLALYLPGPPGLAGVRNVLVNARLGRPPDVWFAPAEATRLTDRARASGLGLTGLVSGRRLPRPVATPPARVGEVVRWLAAATLARPRMLSAFTGPALRVAAAALDTGTTFEGGVLFATGEPVTAVRHRFLEASGLRCFSRYVTAETGIVAAGCPEARTADDMHVWSDRIAVVEHDDALFFTCLSPYGGKVLVNADLGDVAAVERRPCSCRLGELGLELRLSGVHSARRLTAEGASVPAGVLDDIVGRVVTEAGGRPDTYQVVEEHVGDAPARITIVVAPDLELEDPAVAGIVLSALRALGPGERLAADLWERGGVLRVVRGDTRLTQGAKLPGVVSRG